MPLAFPSHQGLILPLWRRWPRRFDAFALCVGAAMPDVVDGAAWPFRGELGQWMGHSLVGLAIACLPAGLALTWLARRALPHRWIARLEEGAGPRSTIRAAVSVGIGALSHDLFDLVTHGGFPLLWPWRVDGRVFPEWWTRTWGTVPLPGYREPYPIGPHTLSWIALTIAGALLFAGCVRRRRAGASNELLSSPQERRGSPDDSRTRGRPQESVEPRTSDSKRAFLRATLATTATSVLAIAAVAALFSTLRPARAVRDTAPPDAQPSGAPLIEGNDYRVLVAVARVKPLRPDGEKWDSGSASTAAPDPFYEIWWHGQRVYKSPEVSDALIATWSNVALPTLFKLIADEKVSLESIKQGALIHAGAGETIEVKVWDDDPFKNDLIESFTVSVADLRVGDQTRAGTQGLESATLRVIPSDAQSLAHFLR